MSLCSEAAAGVNRISYFVAVNVAQIPIIVITPVVYLSLLYPLIAPRGRNRIVLSDGHGFSLLLKLHVPLFVSLFVR